MKKSLKKIYKQIKLQEEIIYKIKKEYSYLSSYTIDEILAYFNASKIDDLQEFIGLNKNQSSRKTSINCKCVDRYGNIKKLYLSYNDAKKDAKRYFQHYKIYPCPSAFGWHISSI